MENQNFNAVVSAIVKFIEKSDEPDSVIKLDKIDNRVNQIKSTIIKEIKI
ncbi:MAG: hypothetical protein FWG64_04095 [Firmicutes bacterium]|nr:hypothetical protein [Bacillota bacterium]